MDDELNTKQKDEAVLGVAVRCLKVKIFLLVISGANFPKNMFASLKPEEYSQLKINLLDAVSEMINGNSRL